ncbi:MAG: GWxTD domain-containing protein, partial [Candidatus Coatesbacteria bacterium]
MKKLITVLAVLFTVTGWAASDNLARVAVLDFEPIDDATAAMGADVADNVRLMFRGAGTYHVEDYRRLTAAIAAAEEAGYDLRTLPHLISLGKALKDDYLVAGSVSYDDGVYKFAAEYIDVNAGEVVVRFIDEDYDLREMTQALITDMSGAEDFGVLFPETALELSDEEYTDLRETIRVIASPEELALFDVLSPRGRSLFLDKFWARRDPYPETPENEYRDEFEKRIAYVKSYYATPHRAGYETDRGVVYVRYGAPDEIEDKSVGTESVRDYDTTSWQSEAYVAWKYYGKSAIAGSNALFVFTDIAGDGDYTIFASTEPGYGRRLDQFYEFDEDRTGIDPM